MKIAIMQPYIFPYLGYFQLIYAVDIFIFYDDVNFIKGGWINRNRILVNNNDYLFTVPLKQPSPNRLINEIQTDLTEKWKSKFFKNLELNYKKSPYFNEVFPLVVRILNFEHQSIGELSEISVLEICNYLNISKTFKRSSEDYHFTKGLERSDRLINIIKESQGNVYINPINGQNLYSKEYFSQNGISLHFLKSHLPSYKHFNEEFIPGLSILDVLMFNSKSEIKEMLNMYELF